MNITLSQVIFYLIASTGLAGAITVVSTRDVMRLILGLGMFLASVALYYLYYGLGFLAVAELFLYVGGVLVMMVIAIMTVHRSAETEPILTNRHSVGAAVVSTMLFALLVFGLSGAVPVTTLGGQDPGIAALGDAFLGVFLAHLEIVGGFLFIGLVAVLAITGGERE